MLNLGLHPFTCVDPLFCEESHFSGPVLCNQHPPVIIPEVSPEVSSLETLVQRVRDATSSTEQQTIAAPLYSNYRCA